MNGNNEEEKTNSVKNYYAKILKEYIPKLLANPDFDYNEKGKTRVIQRVKKEKPTIYEIYSDNTKEEINSAISRLSSKQKRIFDIMNGNNEEEKTNSVRVYYGKIIKIYIPKLLANPDFDYNEKGKTRVIQRVKKEKPTIYEIYSDNTKEEIDSAISRLSSKQKRIFDIMNGNNEEEKTNSVGVYYRKIIKTYIPKLLANPGFDYNEKGKTRVIQRVKKEKPTIYEIYSDNTKEEIDSAISRLSSKQKRIFDIMNGNNEEEKTNSVKNYYAKILKKYIPKLLANPDFDYNKSSDYRVKSNEKNKTIYDRYPYNTKEEVDCAISKLSPANMRIVTLMNGSELLHPKISSEVTISIRNRYSTIVNKIIPKLLCDDTDIKIYNIGEKIIYNEQSKENHMIINTEKIKYFINTKAFNLVVDKFSATEKEIIILTLTNKYDIKDLSKMYNISCEKIIDMVKETLINFKENIINSFEIVQKEYTKKK